jgi:hypothetical protein
MAIIISIRTLNVYGWIAFQPVIPNLIKRNPLGPIFSTHFNSKIKHNKGNLQCDDRDSVKVSKQAITTINNNSID